MSCNTCSCHHGYHHNHSCGCASCNTGCDNICNNTCGNGGAGVYPPLYPCWHHPWHPCWTNDDNPNCSYCPFPEWMHPILCNPTYFCSAENENGPTLVIHQILLEPCGNQSCTPRTFQIRVTGPSYPDGETFSLRAGSCTEIDEPLVIANLEPGQYEIDLLSASCRREYDTTFTGPICGGCVSITNSVVPTVITIVSRKRFTRRRCRRGCGCNNDCGNGCHSGC